MSEDITAGHVPTPNQLDEKEAAMVRSYFKDGEALLISIRSLFFGLPVTDGEKEIIKTTFQNKELLEIFRKRFLPNAADSKSIGFIADVWMGADKMVFGQHKDTIKQALEYKQVATNTVREALTLLSNPDTEGPKIGYDSTLDDELGTTLLARNLYIQHVMTQLQLIWLIANTTPKTETEVEVERRKNSSK